jgi:hypothetical protein
MLTKNIFQKYGWHFQTYKSQVNSSPKRKVNGRMSDRKKNNIKRILCQTWSVVQVVECLHNKHKVLLKKNEF